MTSWRNCTARSEAIIKATSSSPTLLLLVGSAYTCTGVARAEACYIAVRLLDIGLQCEKAARGLRQGGSMPWERRRSRRRRPPWRPRCRGECRAPSRGCGRTRCWPRSALSSYPSSAETRQSLLLNSYTGPTQVLYKSRLSG